MWGGIWGRAHCRITADYLSNTCANRDQIDEILEDLEIAIQFPMKTYRLHHTFPWHGKLYFSDEIDIFLDANVVVFNAQKQ